MSADVQATSRFPDELQEKIKQDGLNYNNIYNADETGKSFFLRGGEGGG